MNLHIEINSRHEICIFILILIVAKAQNFGKQEVQAYIHIDPHIDPHNAQASLSTQGQAPVYIHILREKHNGT